MHFPKLKASNKKMSTDPLIKSKKETNIEEPKSTLNYLANNNQVEITHCP